MPLLHVVGTIEFDPTRVAAVGTRAPGIVTEVLHVEGDEVDRGELLAVIESPAVTEAQTDERVAMAKKRAARANEARERSLLERGLTTAREHEQAVSALEEQRALASAARERVDTLGGGSRSGVSELRAPVAGVDSIPARARASSVSSIPSPTRRGTSDGGLTDAASCRERAAWTRSTTAAKTASASANNPARARRGPCVRCELPKSGARAT
jgi:multidrug efflux pump subunit AcrA (membrane-fusion protein)